MAPDGWMEGRTDGWTDGRTNGHGQTYIPPPSAGDNNNKCRFHAIPTKFDGHHHVIMIQ